MTSLPDIFETRQGEALRRAYLGGDLEQARKIEQHLLAESATTPEERDELAQTLHAAVLFLEVDAARDAGDGPRADHFLQRIRQECAPRAIKQHLAAGLLQAGLREGLTRAQHDQLMGWTKDLGLGPQIIELAENIAIH
ncbi:hypothetical protein AB0442_22975 [Kitasatospora sp. NPDC085895]|uniref:hypothetical protein n=1 Tax=Kitasatospora sp. NPDC085895 TaxID=3155057 RepID=UPI00344C44F1